MCRARWPIGLVFAIAVSGCGGTTATLEGRVAYQGRTVTSGSVIVVNEDGTAESCAILPDGTYTVLYVKRGQVKIGVLSPDPARARSILKPHEKPAKVGTKPSVKAAETGWFALPAQFGNPSSSGIQCDVTGSRTLFDIDLK